MINLNAQLDKVIQEQLSKVTPMLDDIPEGDQKEYIVNAINQLSDNRTLDVKEFIEGFSKLKGETVKKNK